MKNDRRCESCQAQAADKTAIWIKVQRTTRELVVSDWSRNSDSRSYSNNISKGVVENPMNPQPLAAGLKIGSSYPLVHLFTADVLQPAVQVLDTLNDILHLVLIFGFNLAGLADGDVDSKLDSTQGVAQPAGGGVRLGGEANPVLTGVGSREVEATGVAVTLGNNAVVIVEGLLNGDEHLHVVVDGVGPGLGIDDLALETTCL